MFWLPANECGMKPLKMALLDFDFGTVGASDSQIAAKGFQALYLIGHYEMFAAAVRLNVHTLAVVG